MISLQFKIFTALNASWNTFITFHRIECTVLPEYVALGQTWGRFYWYAPLKVQVLIRTVVPSTECCLISILPWSVNGIVPDFSKPHLPCVNAEGKCLCSCALERELKFHFFVIRVMSVSKTACFRGTISQLSTASISSTGSFPVIPLSSTIWKLHSCSI